MDRLSGPPGTVESVSFSDALSGDAPPGAFDGKIVVIRDSPSLQDVHPTAVGGNAEMSGPELQANMISTVLDGFPVEDAPTWVDVTLIVLLGLAVPVASIYLSPRIRTGSRPSAGGRVRRRNSGGVRARHDRPSSIPWSASSRGRSAPRASTTWQRLDRQRIRDVFARFVPERVVDDVLARTDDDLRLGGVKLETTVMFADLRGFTSFSETVEPERVIEVLNRYLESMSDAITARGGTLVAYLGDGIMAVFGAPLEQDDHADRALAAARQMLGPRLEEFNAWLRTQGLGEGFRMGIGLNSGPVMSGNVGSDRRLEYTAIGDTVNTASRLESMTKQTKQHLLIAGSTRALLRDGAVNLAYVDELSVRGRRQKIELWALARRQEAAPRLFGSTRRGRRSRELSEVLSRPGGLELTHERFVAKTAGAHPGQEPALEPLDAGVSRKPARRHHLLQRGGRKPSGPEVRGDRQDARRGLGERVRPARRARQPDPGRGAAANGRSADEPPCSRPSRCAR